MATLARCTVWCPLIWRKVVVGCVRVVIAITGSRFVGKAAAEGRIRHRGVYCPLVMWFGMMIGSVLGHGLRNFEFALGFKEGSKRTKGTTPCPTIFYVCFCLQYGVGFRVTRRRGHDNCFVGEKSDCRGSVDSSRQAISLGAW